jgi:ABC-type glycerol-3-phosphate transport system permease component
LAMAPPNWLVQSIVVAAVVGPVALTGLLAYALATFTRFRGLTIGLVSGLAAPICVVIFAWLSPLTKRDPRSIDGPAYVLIGLICWALLLLPMCMLSSSLGTWLKRRSRGQPVLVSR